MIGGEKPAQDQSSMSKGASWSLGGVSEEPKASEAGLHSHRNAWATCSNSMLGGEKPARDQPPTSKGTSRIHGEAESKRGWSQFTSKRLDYPLKQHVWRSKGSSGPAFNVNRHLLKSRRSRKGARLVTTHIETLGPHDNTSLPPRPQ